MADLLIIEDDITFSGMLEGFLSKKEFRVQVRHQGKEGVKLFKNQRFDLVLLDYRLPDGNGIEFLQEIKTLARQTPVIIMTSFNDVRTAVKAIQSGAMDYILKPVNPDELLLTLDRALNAEKKAPADTPDQYIEGQSLASQKLFEYIRLVSPTDLSVMIEGESGTGKEYVARSIHRLSTRAQAPFIALDCGSISKDIAASELFGHVKGSFTGALGDSMGKLEAANKGTLFLDEVGNLSYDVQVKLLRALQERTIYRVGSNHPVKVDVRIITATNDHLATSVKEGSFREDLFHRLNEFAIEVPPLRTRGDDLLQFASFFRSMANTELHRATTGFSEEVLDAFRQYSWPGNLRELKNVVRRAVLFSTGDIVHLGNIPPEMAGFAGDAPSSNGQAESRSAYDLKLLQENQERELIAKTLQEVGFNKSKAARMLNIDRKTLYSKMEKYKLDLT
jgi:two-component system response regulator HydG